MTEIQREAANPTYTDLVYYLVENINANSTPTSAADTVALMLLLNVQQEALILGYIVIIQAEGKLQNFVIQIEDLPCIAL